MVKKTGRMTYVPRIVLDEIDSIKKSENIEIGSEAFRKLIGYARIGKEFQVKKNILPTGLNYLAIKGVKKKK